MSLALQSDERVLENVLVPRCSIVWNAKRQDFSPSKQTIRRMLILRMLTIVLFISAAMVLCHYATNPVWLVGRT